MSAEKSRPGRGGSPNNCDATNGTGIVGNSLEWLTWLYGEQPRGLIWIGGDQDGWKGRTFTTPRDAAEYAASLDAMGGKGVYHRLTTLARVPEKRGKAESSAACVALAMDLDLAGPNHKADGYPETDADLFRLLDKAGLPEPSAWVHSGGGRYPYWRLSEPLDLTAPGHLEWAEDVSAKLHAHVIEWARHLGWKVDNTRDLARIYRLPGTTNRKNGGNVECRVLSTDGPTLTLAELESALLTAPAPEPVRPATVEAAPLPTPERPAGQARTFTEAQAREFCRPHLEALRTAQDGEINVRLNAAAKVLSHFVPEFWPEAQAVDLLTEALEHTEYDGRTWQAADTIRSAFRSAAGDWKAERVTEAVTERRSRRVDLTEYLDGTYTPPMPAVGGERDDCARLLYPERWHSCIALTGAGKSWFGLWHAVTEIRAGRVVAYAHFEEHSPAGTLDRLRSIAPELATEEIRERFVWLDCSAQWKPGEFAAALPDAPSLVILDGINAACSLQHMEVNDPKAVGAYRSHFVAPATKRGAAVLSLGHPPKARDRQGERHGFGSTAWLDEVDGVGLRLEKAKKTPIQRGRRGYSAVYSVKDRYGQVEAAGTLAEDREGGWYYLGAFWVDSSPERQNTVVNLSVPARDENGNAPDSIDQLANAIVAHLEAGDGRFATQNALGEALRAAGAKVNRSDLGPALLRLAQRDVLEWPEVPRNRARPGWLKATGLEPDSPN
ncbi:hypothetical protein [Micromonospora aurantiaca (nom. illeg.)]|uniref:hypothetical protein n=1 Tax=Micromonospora aurantiaca (nom. illeg.) TaxID=47850 RepID=UPI0035B310BB